MDPDLLAALIGRHAVVGAALQLPGNYPWVTAGILPAVIGFTVAVRGIGLTFDEWALVGAEDFRSRVPATIDPLSALAAESVLRDIVVPAAFGRIESSGVVLTERLALRRELIDAAAAIIRVNAPINQQRYGAPLSATVIGKIARLRCALALYESCRTPGEFLVESAKRQAELGNGTWKPRLIASNWLSPKIVVHQVTPAGHYDALNAKKTASVIDYEKEAEQTHESPAQYIVPLAERKRQSSRQFAQQARRVITGTPPAGRFGFPEFLRLVRYVRENPHDPEWIDLGYRLCGFLALKGKAQPPDRIAGVGYVITTAARPLHKPPCPEDAQWYSPSSTMLTTPIPERIAERFLGLDASPGPEGMTKLLKSQGTSPTDLEQAMLWHMTSWTGVPASIPHARRRSHARPIALAHYANLQPATLRLSESYLKLFEPSFVFPTSFDCAFGSFYCPTEATVEAIILAGEQAEAELRQLLNNTPAPRHVPQLLTLWHAAVTVSCFLTFALCGLRHFRFHPPTAAIISEYGRCWTEQQKRPTLTYYPLPLIARLQRYLVLGKRVRAFLKAAGYITRPSLSGDRCLFFVHLGLGLTATFSDPTPTGLADGIMNYELLRPYTGLRLSWPRHWAVSQLLARGFSHTEVAAFVGHAEPHFDGLHWHRTEPAVDALLFERLARVLTSALPRPL